MSWIGAVPQWKVGLSSLVIGKIEELECQVEKLNTERSQKKNQFDVLQQSLDNQKRKTEQEVKEKQTLRREIEELNKTCQSLEDKANKSHSTQDAYVGSSQQKTRDSISSNLFDVGSSVDELNKKIAILEKENNALKLKNEEFTNEKAIPNAPSTSQSQPRASDDFWSSFSSSKNDSHLLQPSPYKTVSKKAIETSEDNPFRNPVIAPKALEVSNDNPFKTPSKYASHSCLPSLTPTPIQRAEDEVKQLERKLRQSYEKIDQLKVENALISKRASDDSSTLDSTVGKKDIDDSETKVEQLEEKVKSLQSTLDCQKHNSESVKNRLEEKVKQRELEMNREEAECKKELNAAHQNYDLLTVRLKKFEVSSLEEKKKLEDKIDELTNQLSLTEVEKMNARSTLNEMEGKLISLRDNYHQVEQNLTDLKLEIDALSVKYKEALRDRKNFAAAEKAVIVEFTQAKVDKIEVEVILDEFKVAAQKKESEMEEEIKNLKNSLKSSIEKCSSLDSVLVENKTIEDKFTNIKTNYLQLQSDFESQKSKMIQVEQKELNLKEVLTSSEIKLINITNELNENVKKVLKLEYEVKDLKEENDCLFSRCDMVEADKASLVKEKKEMQKKDGRCVK